MKTRSCAGTMPTAKGGAVKIINLLNALYHSGGVSIPISFEVVRRPHQFSDMKTRKVKFGVHRRTIRHNLLKRWKIEAFHRSLKSNAGLVKSPTRTVTIQNNHIFMSIYSVFKLECLEIKHKANHFALRTKLFIKANLIAYKGLQKLRTAQHQILTKKIICAN